MGGGENTSSTRQSMTWSLCEKTEEFSLRRCMLAGMICSPTPRMRAWRTRFRRWFGSTGRTINFAMYACSTRARSGCWSRAWSSHDPQQQKLRQLPPPCGRAAYLAVRTVCNALDVFEKMQVTVQVLVRELRQRSVLRAIPLPAAPQPARNAVSAADLELLPGCQALNDLHLIDTPV